MTTAESWCEGPRLALSPAMRLKRLIRRRFVLSSQAPAMGPSNAMWPFVGRSRLLQQSTALLLQDGLVGWGKASFIAMLYRARVSRWDGLCNEGREKRGAASMWLGTKVVNAVVF